MQLGNASSPVVGRVDAVRRYAGVLQLASTTGLKPYCQVHNISPEAGAVTSMPL
jgi:hypothetical protein